jgi:Protein of unknown function (DUF3891)
MILRPAGSSLLLITQPDHAALAARVMRHWRAGGLQESARRSSILLAVEEHDNGWREVDAAPVLDEHTGRILDFVGLPEQARRAIWPRGVERLAATPYSAALVAQHAAHVYRRYRGSPGWDPFFIEMEALRDKHLRAAELSQADLLADYSFVRLGDLVSLTFCNGWTEPQTDDAGEVGYTIRLDGARLAVTPDPFEEREIAIEIAARELPDHPYRSKSDAEMAYSAAREVTVAGVAVGGS